jgi:hypothetical protein
MISTTIDRSKKRSRNLGVYAVVLAAVVILDVQQDADHIASGGKWGYKPRQDAASQAVTFSDIANKTGQCSPQQPGPGRPERADDAEEAARPAQHS